MRKTKLVLIGAGGHSDSVKSCIDARKYKVVGYIDDMVTGEYRGLPVFGKTFQDVLNSREHKYFVCIGDNYSRRNWYARILFQGYETINIIDRTASVDKTAVLGNGNFIGKHVIIDAEVKLGNNNVVNTGAVIEHGSVIKNHTNISTTAVLNGDVIVEDYAMIGSGAISNGQIRIGLGSIVGSGSVVTKDVPHGMTVVGIPAKELIKREGTRDRPASGR